MKKILIITASLGGGHIATAQAIAEGITSLDGSVEVEVRDILKDLKIIMTLDKFTVPLYSSTVKMMSGYPYKLIFRLSDTNADLINKFVTTILKDQLVKYLEKHNPDVIISTYPIAGYAFAKVITDGFYRKVPNISIITDAGDVTRLWLSSGEDAILVSTPETIDYAVQMGVPKNRLHYLGFPVKPAYYCLPEQADARAKLGLEDRLTVLVTAGGTGLNTKLASLAKKLAARRFGVQYVFVCGRDKDTTTKLGAMKFIDKAIVYGFVDNMPELMAAADIVVGKAGWVTLSEAMASRKPVIIMDVVPGQEEPNAEFVQKHGIGQVLRTPDGVVEAIAEFAAKPQTLDSYQAKFDSLGLVDNATGKVAEFILKYVEAGAND